MNTPYDDIIHLPHHVSQNHPQMPLRDRAAQFAPFAALTGYDDSIAETGRLTTERRELSEQEQNELNRRRIRPSTDGSPSSRSNASQSLRHGIFPELMKL